MESVVISGEILRFHIPKPSRGCEMAVWWPVIGFRALRAKIWGTRFGKQDLGD